MKLKILLLLFTFLTQLAFGQNFTLKGKITNAENGFSNSGSGSIHFVQLSDLH